MSPAMQREKKSPADETVPPEELSNQPAEMNLYAPAGCRAMVFIEDKGSEFKGPLDKVWKLNASEGQHPHASLRNYGHEVLSENVFAISWEQTVAGRNEKSKGKLVLLPPLGYSIEYLEGSFAGSRTFQYYIPRGQKTGVEVVGEWKSPNLSDDALKKEVMKFLETVFNEDQQNLKNLK